MDLKKQPIFVDNEVSLIPWYPNDETTLAWYQDPVLCKQCDNTDSVYDLDRLHAMYEYLCREGDCFYICLNGKPVGDITLKHDGEICIVVSRDYQNRRLGRRSVAALTGLARQNGMKKVSAEIYSFNTQSRKMFSSLGFVEVENEQFEIKL